MNDGELRNLEREVGRLVGALEGVGREIRVLREDGARREETYLKALAEHDQRDDTRFAGVDRELAQLSRNMALRDQRDSDNAVTGQHWHNWQIALLGAASVVAAGLISAVATAHLMGTH